MESENDKQTANDAACPVAEVKEDSTNEATPETNVEKTNGSTETKADVDASPELLEKIKNQVEFYYGDSNLLRDKFLIEQTKLDEGWIPMTIMLNFKALVALSSDPDVILKALETSDLMEISDDRKKIRRSPKHPLPVNNEEYRKAVEARTVYAKGFPQNDMTIEKLKKFLEPFGVTENIVMRRYTDKEKKSHFKGSIFVQFKTLDSAKGFMDQESVKYEDTELIRKFVTTYYADKAKEREEFQKKSNKNKNKQNEENKDRKTEEDFVKDWPRGMIIHLADVSSEISREDIKKELQELGANVAHVENRKKEDGETFDVYIRLQGEVTAKSVVEKGDGKVTISGTEQTCRVLEGDEEEEFFKRAVSALKLAKNKKSNSGRKGGKRPNRGNRFEGGKPAKMAKVE